MAEIEPTQPKWPHLENFDRHPDYLSQCDDITISEKIHGFNGRFGRTPEGLFWVGSRNNIVLSETTNNTHFITDELQGFTQWALERKDKVDAGFTFFGEWAGNGIQSGIKYGEKKFFLFGAISYTPTIPGFLPWGTVSHWAKVLETRHVPIIYSGKVDGAPTIEQIDALRTETSWVAPEQREGIVLFGWKGGFPMVDKYGNVLIIKWKAPQFAERASQKEQRPPLDLTSVDNFVQEYVTEERLKHVLAQVQEATQSDPLDMTNMGNVLKALYADVHREGDTDFNALDLDSQKMVGKRLAFFAKPLLDTLRTDRLIAAQYPITGDSGT